MRPLRKYNMTEIIMNFLIKTVSTVREYQDIGKKVNYLVL
jgi:hypothetical protein